MTKKEFAKKYNYMHEEKCCWTCKFSDGYKDCLECFNPKLEEKHGIETDMNAKCDLWKSNKKEN